MCIALGIAAKNVLPLLPLVLLAGHIQAAAAAHVIAFSRSFWESASCNRVSANVDRKVERLALFLLTMPPLPTEMSAEIGRSHPLCVAFVQRLLNRGKIF